MTARKHSPRIAFLAALLACAALAGCKPGTAGPGGAEAPQAAKVELEPVLADPKVGDLYAAELSHFSGASFEDAEEIYGLMKVVQVSPDQITLNTETAGWPKPKGAINDLRGDLAGIEWDEEEKIQIRRNELAGLVAEKKILETRRLGAE